MVIFRINNLLVVCDFVGNQLKLVLCFDLITHDLQFNTDYINPDPHTLEIDS